MSKFCIDCRWRDYPAMATGDLVAIEVLAACTHPRASATLSPVIGGHDRRPCTAMRGDTAPCGPFGVLWEGKGGKP